MNIKELDTGYTYKHRGYIANIERLKNTRNGAPVWSVWVSRDNIEKNNYCGGFFMRHYRATSYGNEYQVIDAIIDEFETTLKKY